MSSFLVGSEFPLVKWERRKILWEGSLNILSQNQSREIMRRIENEQITLETFNFLKLEKFL